MGRLAPVKKVDELIKVFASVRERYKNIYLLIIGDGPTRESLLQLANKVGSDRIIFKGYVSEEELFSYYGACDIFINPAHIESYGRVYIEAMSAGKPVITTNGVGAVQDGLLLNNVNSLITKAGKLDELRKAIIDLIEREELRKELGENGLILVKKKFNYENSLKRVKEFWKRTIESKRNKNII